MTVRVLGPVQPIEPEPLSDPRTVVGQKITNERHLWEILGSPNAPVGDEAAFAMNLKTGYTLWLTWETISHCRVVLPESIAALDAP